MVSETTWRTRRHDVTNALPLSQVQPESSTLTEGFRVRFCSEVFLLGPTNTPWGPLLSGGHRVPAAHALPSGCGQASGSLEISTALTHPVGAHSPPTPQLGNSPGDRMVSNNSPSQLVTTKKSLVTVSTDLVQMAPQQSANLTLGVKRWRGRGGGRKEGNQDRLPDWPASPPVWLASVSACSIMIG